MFGRAEIPIRSLASEVVPHPNGNMPNSPSAPAGVSGRSFGHFTVSNTKKLDIEGFKPPALQIASGCKMTSTNFPGRHRAVYNTTPAVRRWEIAWRFLHRLDSAASHCCPQHQSCSGRSCGGPSTAFTLSHIVATFGAGGASQFSIEIGHDETEHQ